MTTVIDSHPVPALGLIGPAWQAGRVSTDTSVPADPDPQALVQPTTLRSPRNRPSDRAITYWTVRALPFWVVVALVAGLILFLTDGIPTPARAVVIAVIVVLAAAHLIVMPRWRYRVHRWEATPTAVFTQSGWFVQERRIAPVSRVQTVDSDRGPFEQLFGLANVTVTTASAAGPLKIHALDRDVAERLVQELTDRAQPLSDDAT